MSAGEVLLTLYSESGMAEDGDFGEEDIFCYQPRGFSEAGTWGGDEDGSDEEDSGQPVPSGSRDQEDGE